MEVIPYVALLAAIALIDAPRVVVAREMFRQQGGYDNSTPRAAQQQLEGLGRRAVGAHLNGNEAFAPFAAAVLAAVQRGVDARYVGWLCLGFVGLRTIYVILYLADRLTLRSTVWSLALGCCAALLVLAAVG